MNGRRFCAVFGRFKRAAALALACIICTYGIGAIASAAEPAAAKQPEKVVPRPTLAACGDVPNGRVRCLADVSIDSYSSPEDAVEPGVSGGYGPSEFHTAYQLPCKPGEPVAGVCATPSSFGPETIAIVDAGGYGGSIQADLATYNEHYGLPACTVANGCLTVVNQDGDTSPLPPKISDGWKSEIALDVQTAHMICQTCKIVLVEADDNFVDSLAAAENTAATFSPIAISNSFGADTDVPAYDDDFKHTGIAVVAATGDDGTLAGGQSWPADIPQVVAAAGTTLQLNGDDTWASETVWSGSGGGCSANYAAPSWQTSRGDWAANGCGGGGRAFGDLSAAANPSTGAAIVVGSSWYVIGGTSLSTPLIASMYALANDLPGGTEAVTLPYLNADSSNSHDVTSGNDCTGGGQPNCTAAVGFDVPSGLGTPKGLGLFQFDPEASPTYENRLSRGEALHADEVLGSSPTYPAYRLIMKNNGNLALYKGSKSIWNSHTAHTGSNNRLAMKSNGNLVLYKQSGKAVWSSGTKSSHKSTRPTKMIVKHSGRFGLYKSSGKVIWNSVNGKVRLAEYTRLKPGRSINIHRLLGSRLYKPPYWLSMKRNGNLVLHKKGGKVLWKSRTAHTGHHNRLALQRDGNLVIRTKRGKPVWSSHTAGTGRHNKLVMQGDGNLVLYKKGRPLWSSKSGHIH